MNVIFHDNKQLVSCHVQPKAGGVLFVKQIVLLLRTVNKTKKSIKTRGVNAAIRTENWLLRHIPGSLTLNR